MFIPSSPRPSSVMAIVSVGLPGKRPFEGLLQLESQLRVCCVRKYARMRQVECIIK